MKKYEGGDQKYKADLIAEILRLAKRLQKRGKGNVKFTYKGVSDYVVK